ncbi:MAG: ATP-binding cassette domain-containing protein, partial [Halobacteria archaeon]|nr:ATP-binding cassette domain-containing protein [Halobacteria archaeon]
EIGVGPPVCLDVARNLGLPGSPVTSAEFVESFEERTGSTTVDYSRVEGEGQTKDGDEPSELLDKPTLLEVDDVTYEYSDGTVAVEDVSMEVHEGEVHAVIGGNGAGKTTLSKLLVGLFKPDSGRVLVSEENTKELTASETAESVGIALQNPDEQISESTVEEEIRYPLVRRQHERTGW